MTGTPPRITYYVVLFQQPPDTGAAIRPIARLLQEEEESVRHKLLTHTAQVLARFAKKPNAEGLRSQLRAFGIDTIIVSDQDIRGHLIVSAAAGSKGAGGIAFRDFDSKPLYTPFDDIAGVVRLDVLRKDGSAATLIDLHRKSTSITPRLDASLFDFAAMLSQPGAGIEDFLRELESRAKVKTNVEFGKHRDEAIALAKDFGSRPAEFSPPEDKLPSAYASEDLLAASIWSFLVFNRTRDQAP